MPRRFALLTSIAFACCLMANDVLAADSFAAPAFDQRWRQDEQITPNFWGPLALAHPGQTEDYTRIPPCAPGAACPAIAILDHRLVQYFDKGRMELTHSASGLVTNGLLASEIVKGQIQVGDNAFQPKAPPAIPIAGDPDNPSPTYAQLSTTAAALLAPAAPKPGAFITQFIDTNGALMDGGGFAGISMTPPIGGYDDATKHNVLGVFADYRTRVGLATIGFAISEPFRATVKVAGQQRTVLVQVFERRVLTYTAANQPAFQVEMGNIGAHYYRWRYCV